MPPLPDVTETVQDGGLGLTPADASGVPLLIGVCSTGTVNIIQAFGTKAALIAALGTGPLVDLAATYLDTAGAPVYCCRIASSTAGAAGSITHTGTGTAVLTAPGAATDQFDVIVTITKAAANLAANAATFTYSLDGGDNVSPVIALPVGGTYAIPGTNLTLTFADGTFVLNDTYTFSTTAPSYTLSEVEAVITAVLADSRTWGFLHIIGPAATPSAANTMCAGIEASMDAAATAFRFAFAIIEAPDDEAASNANLRTAFAAASAKRAMVGAGYGELTSPVSGLVRKRNAAWRIGPRIAAIPVHEDPGKVKTGPVTGVVSLYHDEQATPNLDDARFASLRTIIGRQGFYVTNGNLMSPAGSDFKYVQHRRVMDLACSLTRDALLDYLNDTVRVQGDTDPKPGAIFETDARAIEAFVKGKLDAVMLSGPQPHASDTEVTVDRNANILSTSTLPVTVRVIPLGYAKFITVDIGFRNPKLVLSA